MSDEAEQAEEPEGVLVTPLDNDDLKELMQDGELEFVIGGPIIQNGIRLVLEYTPDGDD